MEFSSEEEYDFEYESCSSEDEKKEDVQTVNLENAYYTAKYENEQDNTETALELFENVVKSQPEKGEWGFKAVLEMIKILFRQVRYSEMLFKFEELLSYYPDDVNKNIAEMGIDEILEHVSSGETSSQSKILGQLYARTLEMLQRTRSNRLWFKTRLKQGRLLLNIGDYPALARLFRDLDEFSESLSKSQEEGSADYRGTQMLEVFSLQMQMYSALKDNLRLKALYSKAMSIKAVVPHPCVMGVIRECGGKMRVGDGDYDEGRVDFYEAFRLFDEAADPRKIACLKYLVLASLLSDSAVNPFDNPETKAYFDHPEIVALRQLLSSYESKDVRAFNSILKLRRREFTSDSFLAEHVSSLQRTMLTAALLELIKPYTAIKLQFLSESLVCSVEEVEGLCVSLLLDGAIEGKLDQVDGVLKLEGHSRTSSRTMEAANRWAASLKTVVRGIEGSGRRTVGLATRITHMPPSGVTGRLFSR